MISNSVHHYDPVFVVRKPTVNCGSCGAKAYSDTNCSQDLAGRARSVEVLARLERAPRIANQQSQVLRPMITIRAIAPTVRVNHLIFHQVLSTPT